jgi:hypothetical protein
MSRGRIPRILWGAGFANTLQAGWPLDSALSYSEPRPGFARSTTTAGGEDSWSYGDFFFLSGVWVGVRPSAYVGGFGGRTVTGYDGATGWQAFLAWARLGNTFRFVFDDAVPGTFRECVLVEPMKGDGELDTTDYSRRIPLVMRSNTNAAFTGF